MIKLNDDYLPFIEDTLRNAFIFVTSEFFTSIDPATILFIQRFTLSFFSYNLGENISKYRPCLLDWQKHYDLGDS